MKIVHSIQDIRSAVRQARVQKPGVRIGFVPTMGFLHQGHASLLQAARRSCDFVLLSIFVNPLQFGPNEDFERYPRDEQSDLEVAKSAGADIVFFPSVQEMYPQHTKTIVSVSQVTERLCGASRPGHFDGVATIVAKLFNIVQPDAAFFGLKDAQQVAVISQMVQDLNMPLEIVPCPIIRENDGLAMSSRNVYLQPEERSQALSLSSSLRMAKSLIEESDGILEADDLKAAVIERISKAPLADIDYVEVLAYPSLDPVKYIQHKPQVIVALAVKFGKTRLIDNAIVQTRQER